MNADRMTDPNATRGAGDDSPLLAPPEHVLSTLNADGSRRWLKPRPSPGRFLRARRVAGYLLIACFTLLPHLRADGKPLFLLDVLHRRFTLFGATFLPTDTLLLALLLVGVFLVIFWATALVGRVWCGWACPQTVYLELLFRPLERLLEGRAHRTRTPPAIWRRVVKSVVFVALALVLAHTFLAWFVGTTQLAHWIRSSPAEHPAAFGVMAVTTLLMLADFGFMREQVCTLMCPYGRLQSVLLDRGSLIIGYDARRGEPRGKLKRGDAPRTHGDCIDCHLCVATCPTGIDIRQGLQMECVGCAQCIDACDAVMDQIGRPRGLIRYGTQAGFAGATPKRLRPRVVVYPVLIVAAFAALGIALAARAPLDVEFLRTRGGQYTVLEDGRVSSPGIVKLTNRGEDARICTLELAGGTLLVADNPVTVPAGESLDVGFTAIVPRERYEHGRATVTLRVRDDGGGTYAAEHVVLGPLFSGAAGEHAGEPRDDSEGRTAPTGHERREEHR